jgi:hypothetical protein
MRRTGWLAGLCAVMLTAACGSAHYQGAATTSHRAGGQDPATGPATISAAQAQALARDVLARAQLPPGARVRPGTPPAALSRAPSSMGGSPSASLHQLWTVTEPASAVLRFWAGHTPPGMAGNGSGSSGGGLAVEQFTGYELQRLPAGVNAATLTMSVLPAGPDATVIRADAQVIWYPPRSAAEQVPATAHAVTITGTGMNNLRPVTKTFTSAALLRRLAGMLNGVHAAPRGEVYSCPAELVSYRIAFAASATAAPFLVISDTGCLELSVTADGHAQPTLEMPAGLGPLLQSLGAVHGGGTSVMEPA